MIALLVLSLLATSASADSSGVDSIGARPWIRDSIVTLPPLSIPGERVLSEPRRRLPTAFVSDLAAGSTHHALETVSEILSQATGVRIQRYGGFGAFSAVSLRGAPPGQVSVYLDGVPITSGSQGVVNLSDLPATAIERVEIYRGLAPLEFGPATPGGAINLITVSSPDVREAKLVRGRWDTWEGRASAGKRLGAFSGLLHAGYQGSAGNFSFLDNNATPANLLDDSLTTRVNNRFDAASALATVEFATARGFHARVREDYFRKAQGVPGLGANPARATRLATTRSISMLEAEQRARGWWPRVRVTSSLQRERSQFRDRTGELSVGRHDTNDGIANDRATLALEWPRLPLGVTLHAGGSLGDERSDLHDAADGLADPPQSRRAARAATIGLDVRPVGPWVTLHAARRWDAIDDHLRSSGVAGITQRTDVARVLDSPQAGIAFAPGFGLELRANWCDASRAPDFTELFGFHGIIQGNPALSPERGENWDAGGAWKHALGGPWRAAAEWAHYQSISRDLIVYVRNSASTFRAQNISRSRIRGEELSLTLEGPSGLSARTSITRQSTIDRGDIPFWRGRRLPQRPERVAYALLNWDRGRFCAAADLETMSDDFLDRYNRQRVPGRTFVGASFSFAPFPTELRMTIEGKNLGDQRISDVGGYPLPGRSVLVSLQTRFGRIDPDPRPSEP